MWLTETAEAACGGNPWAATYRDSFRYVNQLGQLAKRGVQTVMHNTLAASEYALIDQATLEPRPNYWAALLWRRLMGSTVLDAGPSNPGVHLFAHCMAGKPGGVTLLAINANQTGAEALDLATAADRYTLTARTLDAPRVQLNGRELAVGPGRHPASAAARSRPVRPRRTCAGKHHLSGRAGRRQSELPVGGASPAWGSRPG